MTIPLRAHGLRQTFRSALSAQPCRVHLQSVGTQHLSYFNDFDPVEIESAGRRWSISMGDSPADAQAVILIAHGSDLSQEIWRIKADRPDLLVAVWLFDNHLGGINNLRTVMAADVFFPSHDFIASYLFNPWSVHGRHVPLCTAQWRVEDIATVFAEAAGKPRRDGLFAAYVDYSFSSRSTFLRGIAAEVPGSDVKLMQPDARMRFFGMSKKDQLREWCEYKVSVVIPVNRDLSTRLFDGLVCGQIVIVSDAVIDLDAVVPPQLQRALPVLRYVDGDYASLRSAYTEALSRYDAEGMPGVARRHAYALRGHHMMDRVSLMLETLVRLDQDPAALVWDAARGGLLCHTGGPNG